MGRVEEESGSGQIRQNREGLNLASVRHFVADLRLQLGRAHAIRRPNPSYDQTRLEHRRWRKWIESLWESFRNLCRERPNDVAQAQLRVDILRTGYPQHAYWYQATFMLRGPNPKRKMKK